MAEAPLNKRNTVPTLLKDALEDAVYVLIDLPSNENPLGNVIGLCPKT